MIVLDASAVLAWLFRERGHEAVAEVVEEACIGTVNLSEVLTRFARDGHDPVVVLEAFRTTAIEVVPFDDALAAVAAGLAPSTRHLGLSLGDRACLALAAHRQLPVLTADRVWRELGRGIEVRLIR